MPVANQTAAWPWQGPDPNVYNPDDPQPASTDQTQAPTDTGPAPTAQQSAQAVVDRYLRWQGSGGATTQVNAQGDGVTDGDGSAAKGTNGQPIRRPIDPDTNSVAPDMPTVAQFNAARDYLVGQHPAGTDVSAPSTAQYLVTRNADGSFTYTANRNYVAPKVTHPNAAPGDAVWDPSANGGAGGYTTPVPARPAAPEHASPGEAIQGADGTWSFPAGGAAPHQTQGQIDQASTDAHNTSVQDQANKQTPDQIQAAALARIAAQGHQDVQDAIAIAQAKVASGEVMPEADAKALQSQLDQINDGVRANYTQQQTLYAHNLDQPNADRTAGIAQENADTSRQARQDQVTQANQTTQVDTLQKQSAAGQDFINQGIKLGVAPSMGVVSMALDPMQQALAMMRQRVQSGAAPPDAMPTPSAPAPAAAVAGPPSAPLPAPGVQPAAAPAAPPLTGEDQSDVQPPPWGGP